MIPEERLLRGGSGSTFRGHTERSLVLLVALVGVLFCFLTCMPVCWMLALSYIRDGFIDVQRACFSSERFHRLHAMLGPCFSEASRAFRVHEWIVAIYVCKRDWIALMALRFHAEGSHGNILRHQVYLGESEFPQLPMSYHSYCLGDLGESSMHICKHELRGAIGISSICMICMYGMLWH